jgi:hypothetical protein
MTSRNGRGGDEQAVRVLIADDQRPTRRALSALLTLLPQPVNVVGEAGDGETAVPYYCWTDVQSRSFGRWNHVTECHPPSFICPVVR